MKVKLHSTKNENESAASCASVPVAPSAPEFHREARVAASSEKSMKAVKSVIRPWHNIDDLRERSLSAWEDFKQHKEISNLMKQSTSWDSYDQFVREGYSHEDACDSVITNLMTP